MKQALKVIAAAAATTAVALSANAATFADFTVDRDLNAATNNSFVADKITGNYVEAIVFTPTNATSGTFEYRLRWLGGQFVADDGTTPLLGLSTGLNSTYQLYAEATGSGSYSISGAATTFTTNAGGSIGFFYDPLAGITTYDNASGAITFANIFDKSNEGEDLALLASGAAISGEGTLDPTLSTCSGGINCGSFGQTSGILLNGNGTSFFTQPIPFYTLAFNSGQLNNFNVAGTQVINGSLDIVFNNDVPEPGSLALAGLALLGLGAARRYARR